MDLQIAPFVHKYFNSVVKSDATEFEKVLEYLPEIRTKYSLSSVSYRVHWF